jgi:putative membrane protein
MESHFDKPQRQSLIGVLILFFDTIRQYVRALLPILIVWVFKFNEINKLYLFIGTVLVFMAIAVIAYLKYLNFTFYLDHENQEFVVNEGVFNKTKTTIQLNKIQQVNINQSLIQRFTGVYALDVDTAGSTKKEGKIKAISHDLAIELKASLLDNEKKLIIVDTDEKLVKTQIAETHPFIKISFLTLLKVGITSNYVKSLSLLMLFFITASDYLNKFTGTDVLHDEKIENYVDKNLMLQTFLIAILFLFCVILMINVVRIVYKYFDYKIARQKGSLLLSFGLLNTKSTIVKPEKVQITTISRNYFQKKMNILELKIKQATGGEKERQESAIEIPGCNENEQNEILKLLFSKIPEKGVMLKPNFRKLVFSIFLSIVLPLSGFFIVASHLPELMDYAYFTIIYIVFIGLVNYFGYRNNRLFINDDFIIKQSGAWDISNEIIEPMKIQAITVAQLFWHKHADIGYLTIHTAGGNIAFQLGDYKKIKEYVNLWLYKIETSNSNWM